MKTKFSAALIAVCLLLLSLAGCSGGAAKITLLPEDADLSAAPNVILEPDKAPYNLGGWLREDVVTWETELPVSGMYHVEIEYSRPANYPRTDGVILIESDYETIDLEFYAEPTGKEGTSDDWSEYGVRDQLGFRTMAGPVTVSVYESAEETGDETPPNFINLRSITLVCDEEDPDYTVNIEEEAAEEEAIFEEGAEEETVFEEEDAEEAVSEDMTILSEAYYHLVDGDGENIQFHGDSETVQYNHFEEFGGTGSVYFGLNYTISGDLITVTDEGEPFAEFTIVDEYTLVDGEGNTFVAE